MSVSDLLTPGAHGAVGGDPVRIARVACDVVQVMARKGRGADVAAALLASHGLVLPGPGAAAEGRGVTALWVQPEGWFVVAPRAGDGVLAGALKASCGDAGSVVDQSHGRSVIRISGARAAWGVGEVVPGGFASLGVRAGPGGFDAAVSSRCDAAAGGCGSDV